MKEFKIKLSDTTAAKLEIMYQSFKVHWLDFCMNPNSIPTFEEYLSQIIGFYLMQQEKK